MKQQKHSPNTVAATTGNPSKANSSGIIPKYPTGFSPRSSKITSAPRDLSTFEPYTGILPIDFNQLNQWIEAVRIQALSAVEWTWTEGWGVGPRVISDSMWFWFESGCGWGWVGTEARRFRISPGDLVLIPQGSEHLIRQDAGVSSKVVAVHFHAQIFGGINLLDLLGFPAHLPVAPEAPYEGASKRLAREFAVKAPGWISAIASQILDVLLYILRHHGADFHIPGEGKAHAELPRLLPVLELIDQKLADPELAIRDLAGRIFLGEVQFRKLFRRVTGMSPQRFIQRQRIERACALLLVSELSVEQVAEKCGFTYTPFFHRVFRAWTRTSPGNYRKVVRTIGPVSGLYSEA